MTQLQALRARINGPVFVPGDEGYDTARQTWNVATFDQHPAIVVMPAISADVVSAVSFAREHTLSIAVQGGGHGHPHPADDALLVNFANMTSVHVTPVAAASNPSGRSSATGTARTEAGAKWRDVIAAAHPHGLAPLNGFAGTVGVSGYTLGGGIGWLVRRPRATPALPVRPANSGGPPRYRHISIPPAITGTATVTTGSREPVNPSRPCPQIPRKTAELNWR